MDIIINYLQTLPDSFIYLVLGLSAFVENLFPPIPGDTIIAFGAFLVGAGRLKFFGVYLSTTIGSLLGFMVLFWLGSYLGRKFFIERDLWLFKAKDIIKAEEWFRKYGYFIISLNRFFPGVRSVISVAGGISGLRGIRVAVLALLSCALWNFIWVYTGYYLGHNWEEYRSIMSSVLLKYNIMVVILFIIVAFILVTRQLYMKNRS